MGLRNLIFYIGTAIVYEACQPAGSFACRKCSQVLYAVDSLLRLFRSELQITHNGPTRVDRVVLPGEHYA